MCKHCGIEESMEHILTECEESGQSTIWDLARQILTARDPNWPKIDFGTIMGCGSIKIFSAGQKMDEGKTRLFRIVVSESAHLIWKTRCRVVVKEEMVPTTGHIINLWTRAINERLAEDRRLTNPYQHRNKALEEDIVLNTCQGTLKDEKSIPASWIHRPEVLVGMGNQLNNSLDVEEDKESLDDDDSLSLDHG
ncbi:hypothetical protein C8J56DRAFT_795030 [Mycena floridula]|nr:hypothetical protein C8J56DRAFT_795030 [Mycena floridula]